MTEIFVQYNEDGTVTGSVAIFPPKQLAADNSIVADTRPLGSSVVNAKGEIVASSESPACQLPVAHP